MSHMIKYTQNGSQIFYFFAYLKKYRNTEMIHNPSDPKISENDFNHKNRNSGEFDYLNDKKTFLVFDFSLFLS